MKQVSNLTPVTEFTIERERWGRYVLYSADTTCFCAVGFLARKMGISARDMAGTTTLMGAIIMHEESIPLAQRLNVLAELFPSSTGSPQRISEVLYSITTLNDARENHNPEKEAGIAKLFAKLGVRVTFVGNKYPYRVDA